jgi:hypothetical protein
MLAGGGGGGGDELVVRGDSVACLEYFSEDQRLASGGWDSDLRVWDVNPSSPGFKSLLAGRKLAAPVLALAAKVRGLSTWRSSVWHSPASGSTATQSRLCLGVHLCGGLSVACWPLPFPEGT